ncbi:glycosyltransferase family 2 protein [Reichenbachiella sp.]|uniref:glycosyltransferase family 2 protein n=1 Tax=Reichenbachiella sp. TaxID=2184521 RepID=UPI003BB01B31
MKKIVSIIIRTLNEQKYLPELLSSINSQICSFDIEVVVVDSGSTDQTLEILKKFEHKVVHIKKEDFSFGRSLNYGCREANGEYLVFISAHCIPQNNDWLENLVAPFSDPKVAMTYGRQIGKQQNKFSEHQVFKKYYPKNLEDAQGGYFSNNANSAILKSLWDKRNFNEELTGLEDMDWAKFFWQKKYSIQYVPVAVVYHIHEETWRRIKIRYEREAIALREIMPEIHFNFFDFLKSVYKGILNDIKVNISKDKIPNKLFEIVLFRFCQFYGSYKGNHSHRKLSNSKKENYFYP